MKVTGIKVSQKSRLGMTEYNGVDLETSIYVELDESDDPETCLDDVTNMVRASIKARAAPYLPFVQLKRASPDGSPTVEVTELYQGRPVLKDD